VVFARDRRAAHHCIDAVDYRQVAVDNGAEPGSHTYRTGNRETGMADEVVGIVGAGIIGLAIGREIIRRWPGTRVVVLEKETGSLPTRPATTPESSTQDSTTSPAA